MGREFGGASLLRVELYILLLEYLERWDVGEGGFSCWGFVSGLIGIRIAHL